MDTKEILQLAHYRNTPQRYDFIDILNEKRCVDSAEFKRIFIKKSRANVATFYRLLVDFRSQGFVHVINEDEKEYIFLCQEARNGKMPSMTYELTHCHRCGNIEDKHKTDTSKNTLRSYKEVHVENCSQCVSK
jgi:Fe2+ or Zn2+ uptake regulation protein